MPLGTVVIYTPCINLKSHVLFMYSILVLVKTYIDTTLNKIKSLGLRREINLIQISNRWCKLRIAMVPHTLLLEPFSECMVLGLVSSWAGCVLLHADYLTFFLFHTLTWSLADWIMLNIVQVGTNRAEEMFLSN